MNLVEKTPAEITADRINEIQASLARFVESQLVEIYALANTEGQQQAILDTFGSKAVAALTAYGALHAALAVLAPTNFVTPPNLAIFQPQPDGTVIYSAPAPD